MVLDFTSDTLWDINISSVRGSKFSYTKGMVENCHQSVNTDSALYKGVIRED